MSHIMYDRSKSASALLASDISAIIRIRGDLDRIKALMDEITAGGTTCTNLETSGTADGQSLFGVSAGNGQAFYNTIVSVRSSLAAITAATLGDIDLGV